MNDQERASYTSYAKHSATLERCTSHADAEALVLVIKADHTLLERHARCLCLQARGGFPMFPASAEVEWDL